MKLKHFLYYSIINIVFHCPIVKCDQFIIPNDIKPLKEVVFFPDEIEFYDLDGEEARIEDFDDQIIVMIFWASWSTNSVTELHKLDNLQKDFRKLPIKIMAVSEDFINPEKLKAFIKTQNYRYLNFYYDKANKLMKKLKISGLPSGIVINKTGNIVAQFNQVKWQNNEARQYLINLLDDAKINLPRNTAVKNNIQQNVKNLLIKPKKKKSTYNNKNSQGHK